MYSEYLIVYFLILKLHMIYLNEGREMYDLFNGFDACRLVVGVLFFLASSNGCCHIYFARLGMRFQIRLWLVILFEPFVSICSL
jgi:hypothetical protein